MAGRGRRRGREDWVRANGDQPSDQLSELVRHLDAARRAADSIARRAA